jgi:K(+)-stimulated pyrophosphate-energized sodium pump
MRIWVQEMILPSLLPILVQVIVGFGMNPLLVPGAGIRALFEQGELRLAS